MGSAEKIIRFVIAAVIGVLCFMNIFSATLGNALLELATYFNCNYISTIKI